MAKAPIAKRYAQALFSLAEGEGMQEAWLDSLSGLARDLAGPSTVVFFTEPRVPAAHKAEMAAQASSEADPLVRNFLGLLVERRAVVLLPAIVQEYGALLNESLGRVQATVTSAAPVSDEQQSRLIQSLGAMLDKQVVLDFRENPDIIGGIVVRVGDQVIDGSVRARLDSLQQSLERQSLT